MTEKQSKQSSFQEEVKKAQVKYYNNYRNYRLCIDFNVDFNIWVTPAIGYDNEMKSLVFSVLCFAIVIEF